MAPTARLDLLRARDYTALATLGLAQLYDTIGVQLETDVASSEGNLFAPPATAGAAVSVYTDDSCGIDTGSSRTQKHDGTFSTDEDAGGGSDHISQAAARSGEKRMRSNDDTPKANSSIGGLRSSSKRRARKIITSSNNQAESQMRSAFERVQFDDRSDGAGTSGNDLLGNRDRTHNSCLGAIRSAGDIPASARAKECGEMWFDRYVIVGKLGEGAFSEVFLAADTFIRRMGKKHDRTRLVTIKRMNTRDGLIGMSDYHIISQLNSLDPRSKVPIVRVFDIFQYLSHAPAGWYSDNQLRKSRSHAHDVGETESMDESNSPGSSMATMREVPGGHVCLVMEPLLGASLHEAFPQKIREIYTINDEVVAKRVHMGLIQTIGRQMLVAVAHMHNNSLIHADIKSSNVICADDSSLQVKLIDFGNAVGDRDVAEYYSTFEIQTVWFRAPEVAYQQPFGKAIDLWSIACILCELWLGRSLFTDSNNRGLIRSMWKLRGPPPARIYSASPVYRSLVELWSVGPAVGFATPISPGQQHGQSAGGSKSSLSWDSQVRRQWLKYSLRVDDDDFVSLVDSLLEYDPEARLTASEALEHPFFLGTFPS